MKRIIGWVLAVKAALIAAVVGIAANTSDGSVKAEALAARDSIREVMEGTRGVVYARGGSDLAVMLSAGDDTAARLGPLTPADVTVDSVWAMVVENQLTGRLFVVGDGDQDGPGGKGKWYADAWDVNGPQPTQGDDLPEVQIITVAWVTDLEKFGALENAIARLGDISWVSGPTPLDSAEMAAAGLADPQWRLDAWMLAVDGSWSVAR